MFCENIQSHYSSKWTSKPAVKTWRQGPINALPAGFRILEFAPTERRRMWTYATCCMSQPSDTTLVELHLFSPIQTELHVELLTAIAHYHRTGRILDLGHTVNFGRPWLDGSKCSFGLISLPYLDGPDIEQLQMQDGVTTVNCFWLIPITKTERDYKMANGVDALERKFEELSFKYLDPLRQSVV